MKNIRKSNVVTVSDSEYNKLLHEIAVSYGLQVPETSDEIVEFEKAFANEIAEANKSRPSLEDVLALARQVKNSGASIVQPIEKTVVEPRYRMAARNGNEITKETEDLMDKAIKKAKEKGND